MVKNTETKIRPTAEMAHFVLFSRSYVIHCNSHDNDL